MYNDAINSMITIAKSDVYTDVYIKYIDDEEVLYSFNSPNGIKGIEDKVKYNSYNRPYIEINKFPIYLDLFYKLKPPVCSSI